jgi:hypothetical protein
MPLLSCTLVFFHSGRHVAEVEAGADEVGGRAAQGVAAQVLRVALRQL